MFLLKAAAFFWLLKLFECALVAKAQDNSDLVAKAIIKIFDEVCGNSNTEIYVTVLTNDEFSKKIASEIIKNFNNPVQVETKIKVLQDRRRFYVLIVIDDIDGFMKFYQQISVDKFYFNGFFVMFYRQGTLNVMNKMFELLWKIFVFNVTIVTENVEIFTFMPFGTFGKCGDVTTVKINDFNKQLMRWSTSNFFPSKFTNLNGCSIKCGVFDLLPAIIVKNHNNGSIALSGFDVDTFNELMKSINAVVKYTVYPIDTGTIYPNGSATGLLGHTIRGEKLLVSVLFDRKPFVTIR
jgi:hypothetical protein